MQLSRCSNVLNGKLAENAVNIPSVPDKVFDELTSFFPLAERLGWTLGSVGQRVYKTGAGKLFR